MDSVVATLGTEPQVVTIALDALLARGYPIADVTVVHTQPSALGDSLHRLRAEEHHYAQRTPPVRFRYVPVRDGRHYPADIVCEEDAALLLRVLYREVVSLKRARRRVHLCIAGGRKVMAAYSMAVAQLLLDEDDCVWHLLSPPDLLRSRQMHAPDGAVLVPVPVLRWSLLPSTLSELLVWDDPYRAIQRQRQVREGLRRRLLWGFWRELTAAERRVLAALVRHGGTNEELAQALGRSPKTVANQLQSVYDKYRAWTGLPEGRRVRERLMADLLPYLDVLERDAQTGIGSSTHADHEVHV
ncbi:MAG TPA: CRISPR-associated ring nuclease [Dehalococcoidia bacterium]|nr:CRISPR-associated ring nuclease [Dehalococcoidia bacterium]